MENNADFPVTRLPALVQVGASLRCADPRLASLSHIVDIISACIDVSVLFTPAQAVTTSSSALLNRVLVRVMKDHTVDAALCSHWLARAMESAITKSNLNAVQLIHRTHPEPLHVHSLQLALLHGTLEMVQWIVEHRSDRRCCEPGLQNLCLRCLESAVPTSIHGQDVEAIVQWLVSAGISVRATSGLARNAKIARWLDENQVPGTDDLLRGIISRGPPEAVDTVRYLIEQGQTVADEDLVGALVLGSCQRTLEPIMDVVVASRLCDPIRDKLVWAPTRAGGAKVLQLDAAFMADTFVYGTVTVAQNLAFYAAHFGHVDTLQWLWHERGIPPAQVPRKPTDQEDLLAMYQWFNDEGVDGWSDYDVVCAAGKGFLPVIQWLHVHRPDQFSTYTMNTAARNGHLNIVKWLHAHRTEGCTDDALNGAAENGHLDLVKWLSSHRPEGNTNEAMNPERQALDALQWLNSNYIRSANCVGRCVNNHHRRTSVL